MELEFCKLWTMAKSHSTAVEWPGQETVVMQVELEGGREPDQVN